MHFVFQAKRLISVLTLGLLLGGCTSTSSSKVPASIVDVGEFGENIYDAAQDANWTAAAQKLSDLSKAADRLPADVPYMTDEQKKTQARLAADLTALRTSIAAKNQQNTLQSANDVTLVGEQLSVPFSPAVPPAVTHLDYLGRELLIWSAANDLPKLQRTSVEISATWATVRPMIAAKGKTDLAKTFSDLVARVNAAKTAKEFEASAAPLLDEVDNLEKAFK